MPKQYIFVKTRENILGYPEWLKSRMYKIHVETKEIIYIFQLTECFTKVKSSLELKKLSFGGLFVDESYIEEDEYMWNTKGSTISDFPVFIWENFWEAYYKQYARWLCFIKKYPEALDKITQNYSEQNLYIKIPKSPLISNFHGICKTPYCYRYSKLTLKDFFKIEDFNVYPIDITNSKEMLVAKPDGYYINDKRLSNTPFVNIYITNNGYEFHTKDKIIYLPKCYCLSARTFARQMAKYGVFFFTHSDIFLYKLLNTAKKREKEKKYKNSNFLLDF